MQILKVRDEIKMIESTINKLGDGLNILEAGCGRRWPLNLAVTYRLVGIEPDERALRIRMESRGDLDEFQVSTIHDAEFPSHSFDVIYCSYVLEHVVGVRTVIEKFAKWTKPNGLIILRIPDRRSVYGFLARTTPHWVHIAFRRYINKEKRAGSPGYGPYPVVYESEMSLESIRSFCENNGYSMTVTANGQYLEKTPWLAPFTAIVSMVSLGYLRWRHCDLAILIRT